jgi:hypothetical protein
MFDMTLKRGDLVFFWNDHHKVRYFGIVIREVTRESDGTRRYACRFWNKENKYFGRRIFINEKHLEFIAPMPDFAEWDLDDDPSVS